MDLQENKKRVKQKIYPFINDMVDTLYNDSTNELIERVIENNNDKSVFLMFIMMYYGIHLQLDKQDDDNFKREQIKILMTDLIRDPQKRQFCIEVLNTFSTIKPIQKNDERLFLENKDDDNNK